MKFSQEYADTVIKIHTLLTLLEFQDEIITETKPTVIEIAIRCHFCGILVGYLKCSSIPTEEEYNSNGESDIFSCVNCRSGKT